MKHKDDSLEWHDENELVRKLDVVEAVLNLADTIDDVIDVIMSVPNTDAPYIDIETGILHWHGWEYRRIEDCCSTADTPQTDCDKCIWNVCNYNKVEWDADTPQADEIGDCNICRFAGCSECDDCINGSEWVRETEIDDLD